MTRRRAVATRLSSATAEMSARRRRDEEAPLDGVRDPREHWRDIFRKYDRDRDGRIGIGELQSAIRSPEYEIGDIPDATARQIMDSPDGDGYLDEEKFAEMMLRPACSYVFRSAMWKYARLVVPPRGGREADESRGDFHELREDFDEYDMSSYGGSSEVFVSESGGPVPVPPCADNWEEDFDEYGISSGIGAVSVRRDAPFEVCVRASSVPRAGGGEGSCWPAIVCLMTVSLLEIALFAYDALAERNESGTGAAAARLVYDPRRRREAWRFISYALVHVGSAHLSSNVFVQLLLGIPLGMIHCWWRVLLVYSAGVAAGSLGTSVFDPDARLAGASGGVWALIAAHLPTLFMRRSEMKHVRAQFVAFVIFAILNVEIVADNGHNSDLDLTGYESHYAGAISGLLVGVGVFRDLKAETREKKVWWCAVVVYFALTTAAVFANIFWSDRFPASSPDRR